jgi:CubicO group peptidase (beta-lactamase class C family)
MKIDLKGFVDSGQVPGYVALVSKGDEVQVQFAGTRTEGGEPLARDSIFRITSMTKPITAVVTLLLIEQGKMKLQDPVEKWLPELASRRVLKRPDGALIETVSMQRPMTVEDLLTFRMGFGMIMDFSKKYPILEKFEELELLGLAGPDATSPLTHEEWLKRFATLPFIYQPGEIWQYGTAYYLLSVLLARVSGKRLDQLFEELVFSPLGMKDTSFVVPSNKLDRFSDCYWFDSENDQLEIADSAEDSDWSFHPNFFDAAAGLVSTVDDYLIFAKMLLNQGKHEGRQFLSAENVKAMTENHLTSEQRLKPTFDPDQWRNFGYGYGVSVLTEESRKVNGKVGQYGWDGGFGSSWRNDPKLNLCGIILTERTFDSPALPVICETFWDQVYDR